MDERARRAMARRVGLNCLVLLVAAAFVGNYVLAFFDISLAVVRVGGGLLVAATAWRLLAADGEAGGDAPGSSRAATPEEVAGRAFYPLSFPITVGPGSISIAITLGASLPASGVPRLSSSLGLLIGIWLASRGHLARLPLRLPPRAAAGQQRHGGLPAPFGVHPPVHRRADLLGRPGRAARAVAPDGALTPPCGAPVRPFPCGLLDLL